MASCSGGRWGPGALSGPGDEDVIEAGSEETDPPTAPGDADLRPGGRASWWDLLPWTRWVT